MLTLEINGQTSASIRQGDVARFEVLVDGDSAGEVLVDFEGSGAWETAQGPVFRRTYREPGRFVATVRSGNDSASARVRVTRVTVTGGAGLF
jgi:hypothetical protein